ncbi:hypothetical protein [Novosphingobium humi]|uniref:hypothetical protein n=1 Tax=Novosphingobium humi TaxID=2282397 RepID=UPI0025B22C2B|nr:hypothetical protein [Novosphingobium humi]WJT00754.1 hypothetical protein NYQ05_16680 [Novosphingobium humi]
MTDRARTMPHNRIVEIGRAFDFKGKAGESGVCTLFKHDKVGMAPKAAQIGARPNGIGDVKPEILGESNAARQILNSKMNVMKAFDRHICSPDGRHLASVLAFV